MRTRLPLAPNAPAPHRPRCAGLRLCIWRAKSHGRPPLSLPSFSSPATRSRRGRAPRGSLLPLAGNHLAEKLPRTSALERANPPTQTSPQLGRDGTGRRLCRELGRKLRSAGEIASGKEPELTPGTLVLRRRQGDSSPSSWSREGRGQKPKSKKAGSPLSVALPPRAEMLPGASDGTDGAQKRCCAQHQVPQNRARH